MRERERSYSPPRRGGPPGAGTGNPYSPPPARAERYGGGHRARSPPPDAEQMNIESSLVGLIIGRGGETLRRVEQETGARVQFLTNGQDRDSGGERVCNIQGTRPQIGAARRAIEQIIAENGPSGGGMGGPSGGAGGRGKFSGSGGQPNLRDGGLSAVPLGDSGSKKYLSLLLPFCLFFFLLLLFLHLPFFFLDLDKTILLLAKRIFFDNRGISSVLSF